MTGKRMTIGCLGACAMAWALMTAGALLAADGASPSDAALKREKKLKETELAQLTALKNATSDVAALRAKVALLGVYDAQKNDQAALALASDLLLANQASDAAVRTFANVSKAIAGNKEIKAKDFSAVENALLKIEKELDSREERQARDPKSDIVFSHAQKSAVLGQLFLLYGQKPNAGAERLAYAKKLLAEPGTDVNQKAAALGVLAGLNRTTYGPWNPGFQGRYMQLKPEAELARMQDDYLAYLTDLAQLQLPNTAQGAANRNELGDAYLYKGDVRQAADQYQANVAMGAGRIGKTQYGKAVIGLANCRLAQNNKPAAIKALEDLVATATNTAQRADENIGRARTALHFLKGLELDYLKLPYYTDAKAYPTPQQATYKNEFAPIPAGVKLALGKGIDKNDVRLQFLKQKFERFGIPFDAKAAFTVKIELAPTNASVASGKAEGYTLTVTATNAAIVGNDTQGVLWGIVSLIQMVDQEKKALRLGEIADWPDTARRGYLEGFWKDSLEFALFNKMNSITSQHGPFGGNEWTPLNTFITQEAARQFKAFGLQRYYGVSTYTMGPKLPLSQPSTLALHVREFSKVAEAGGGIYFPFDDGRYPLNEMDEKACGIGANLDAKYLTELFLAIREKYPDFKMIFCPPFYWGPDAPAGYPEDRENYLKSMGEFLHPDVQLYWTGPGVKGLIKTKRQVDWFTELTKHKPTIFQNGTGPHNLKSYIVDETDWNGWHYPGFFENDIYAFHKNSHMGSEGPQNSTLADCLWNVKAYDPAKSVKASTAMLFGKDMYDILKPGRDAMTFFDKYPYGGLTPEIMTENVADLEAKARIAADCWVKATTYNAFALANYGGAYGGGVSYAAKVAMAAKNPPDFFSKYKKDIADTEKVAQEQVGIDKARGDIFKSPVDMPGGILMVYAHKMCPVVRFVAILYAAQTTPNRATGHFACDPFPPAGPYDLYMSAMDDERPEQVKIRIAVNDKTIFEGPNPFPAKNYSVQKFTIPFEALQRSNMLTVENLDPGANAHGPPWFMVNYIVLKKAPAK